MENTTDTKLPASPPLPAPIGSARDVTKDSLPRKEWHDLAEDLLARFPGVDRAELLKDMVAHYFLEMKHGNKREERAACDFLNEVQKQAIRNAKKAPNAAGERPAITPK
jgi:hypothetical protein